MNISNSEQCALHVLARGGVLHFERTPNDKIRAVTCITRDGHLPDDCTVTVFERLKKRRFIRSVNGTPYRATRPCIASVRAQTDNR